MARAKEAIETETPLYERDFVLWVEEQVRLLREGRLGQLDALNLIDEIEDLSTSRKHAVTGNLVVILNHLLKYQFQPRRRSRSWLASIAEHRRRLRKEFQHAPSLRHYAREQFEEILPGRPPSGAYRDRPYAGRGPEHLPLYARASPRSGVSARLSGAGASSSRSRLAIALGPFRNWRDSERNCHQDRLRSRPMIPARAVVLVTLLILSAPFNAWAADLVVWWEEGRNPEENAAVREIIAPFEHKSGKQVELAFQPRGRPANGEDRGSGRAGSARLPFGQIAEL